MTTLHTLFVAARRSIAQDHNEFICHALNDAAQDLELPDEILFNEATAIIEAGLVMPSGRRSGTLGCWLSCQPALLNVLEDSSQDWSRLMQMCRLAWLDKLILDHTLET